MTPTAGNDPEFSSPAERTLHDRLEIVRAEPPRTELDLVSAVGRTLRRQALLAVPVTAAFAIAGGIIGGFRTLIRSRAS